MPPVILFIIDDKGALDEARSACDNPPIAKIESNKYIIEAKIVPITVLLLILTSGFFISPPETTALSNPTNDHKVTAIAGARDPNPVTSEEE